MFHPVDHPLERGWVGRIDGDRVIQLAAQTLQSFFTGGGTAREHAEYPLAEVRLLAPVLHPPSVRVFEDQLAFVFANPAAIVGPGAVVKAPSNNLSQRLLTLVPRVAGVIGGDGMPAGFTPFAEWRTPGSRPPKDRDFALGLGPVVVTSDDLDPERIDAIIRVNGQERLRGSFGGFGWRAARDHAGEGTALKPGDLLVGPGLALVDGISPESFVELDVQGIGVLEQVVGD